MQKTKKINNNQTKPHHHHCKYRIKKLSKVHFLNKFKNNKVLNQEILQILLKKI